MAKVSPLISTTNGGEWSPMMEGRVNVDRYKTAVRKLSNFACTSQGPAIRRSGGKFIVPLWDQDNPGRLIDFEFSAVDAFMLGFENQRARIVTHNGVLLREAKAVTSIVSISPDFVLEVEALHGFSVGDEVFFGGFSPSNRLFNAYGRVSAVSTNDIMITGVQPPPGLTLAGGETLAEVFHITTPHTTPKLPALRSVQSTNTLYLFEPSTRTIVLTRNSTYDWPIREFAFADGPFLPVNDTDTRLTPSATGSAITAFNPANAIGTGTVAHSAAHGMDGLPDTYWESATKQGTEPDEGGRLGYDFGVATPLRGYWFTIPREQNSTFAYKDYAPLSWSFEGSADNMAWTVIESQREYVLYTGARSVFFRFAAEQNFRYYRINITAVQKNGAIPPRIENLFLVPALASSASHIVFTATSTVNINGGQGFLPTDVSRSIRVRGSDNFWRWYNIFIVSSPTVMVAEQKSENLPDIRATGEWRLGIFSDTTGWPSCGYFFEDRLIVGGGDKNPDLVCASVTGGYEVFSPSDPDGVVTDTNGWVAQLNGRRVGAVRWLQADARGLLIGTLNGPWLIRPADNAKALTATNARARPVSGRGCSPLDPIQLDNQVLFVPRSQRILRELAYVYDVDGYNTPNMSLYSAHFGMSKFKRFVYAAEPHSIIWGFREDGMQIGFTYNREEDVMGWHRHPIGASGAVEDVSVLPSEDASRDDLWKIVRRTVENQTRRYIEIEQPLWDFTSTLDNCWFVDCGFLYEGPATTTVQGAWFLEGQLVSILADGVPVTPQHVTEGRVTLPFPASRVVLGPGFDSDVETLRPEAGAADGTAQGKTKRIHKAVARLWDTLGGEIGPPAGLQQIDYRHPDHEVGSRLEPFTGDLEPIDFPDGYDRAATIAFRQPGANPLPFNLIAIMPQMFTQDAQ